MLFVMVRPYIGVVPKELQMWSIRILSLFFVSAWSVHRKFIKSV